MYSHVQGREDEKWSVSTIGVSTVNKKQGLASVGLSIDMSSQVKTPQMYEKKTIFSWNSQSLCWLTLISPFRITGMLT